MISLAELQRRIDFGDLSADAAIDQQRAITEAEAYLDLISKRLVGQGLKRLYLRVRPYDALPEVVRLLIGKPKGTSWPSSHPAVLLAFLTVAGPELVLGIAYVCPLAATRSYVPLGSLVPARGRHRPSWGSAAASPPPPASWPPWSPPPPAGPAAPAANS